MGHPCFSVNILVHSYKILLSFRKKKKEKEKKRKKEEAILVLVKVLFKVAVFLLKEVNLEELRQQ